jgi:hypothetical protein
MSRQRWLDFRREGLGRLWDRLPERERHEVIAIYARLIARATQRRRRAHEDRGGAR